MPPRSRCDLDLWPFRLKISPVYLDLQLQLNCEFGEIPPDNLYDIVITDFIVCDLRTDGRIQTQRLRQLIDDGV